MRVGAFVLACACVCVCVRARALKGSEKERKKERKRRHSSGVNFVWWRFAVRARPGGENVSFDTLSRVCLESSASVLALAYSARTHT